MGIFKADSKYKQAGKAVSKKSLREDEEGG